MRSSSVEQLLGIHQWLQPVATEHPLVRVGSEGDGGYLVPDDLVGISRVFSPGVADNWDFELEIAALTGASVHLIEVNEAPADCPFDVDRGFLGGFSTEGQLGINEWVRRHDGSSDSDLLLQMDIEGSEYQVLSAIEAALLDRFRILVVEFHRLDLLASADWLEYVFVPVMSRLRAGYHVVHTHANNRGRLVPLGGVSVPELLEVTFLRRDRVHHLQGPASIPHLLDVDNDSSRQPLRWPPARRVKLS